MKLVQTCFMMLHQFIDEFILFLLAVVCMHEHAFVCGLLFFIEACKYKK
jgi:hypothetical protein